MITRGKARTVMPRPRRSASESHVANDTDGGLTKEDDEIVDILAALSAEANASNDVSTRGVITDGGRYQRPIPNFVQRDEDTETERKAIKLDRLTNKRARYESHLDFLNRCISSKLIPNALSFELEPTIGNHDNEFVGKWYDIIQQCQLKLMSLTSEFCQNTISKTDDEIKHAYNDIKQNTSANNLKNISETIKDSDRKTRSMLRSKKMKKFTYLKYGNNKKYERKRDRSKSNDRRSKSNDKRSKSNERRNKSNERRNVNTNNNSKPLYSKVTMTNANNNPNKNSMGNGLNNLSILRSATTNNDNASTTNYANSKNDNRPQERGADVIDLFQTNLKTVTDAITELNEQFQTWKRNTTPMES